MPQKDKVIKKETDKMAAEGQRSKGIERQSQRQRHKGTEGAGQSSKGTRGQGERRRTKGTEGHEETRGKRTRYSLHVG